MLEDTFANRLKKALDYNNMKPVDLANKTGINKSLISNYLSGSFKAKQDKLDIIARVLNVSEVWLMGYDVASERIDNNENNQNRNSKVTSFSTKNGVKVSIEMDNQITAEDVLEALDYLKKIQNEEKEFDNK